MRGAASKIRGSILYRAWADGEAKTWDRPHRIVHFYGLIGCYDHTLHAVKILKLDDLEGALLKSRPDVLNFLKWVRQEIVPLLRRKP